MSAVFLSWRTVTHSRSPQFLVKGAVLSNAIVGPRSRFMVEEIRTYDADRNANRRYQVRDAESIGDAEIKAGKRPPVVAHFSDLDELDRFLLAAKQEAE